MNRLPQQLLLWGRTLDSILHRFRRALKPAPVVVFSDVTAGWLSSALAVAAKLRLAESVDDGGVELGDLAGRLEVPLDELARLLRFLVANGYFHLAGSRVYPSRLSRALRQGVGGSFAELQGDGWYHCSFDPEVVVQGWRTGRPAFELRNGQRFFEFLAERDDKRVLFQRAMSEITNFCLPFLVASLPLSAGDLALDIGGGNGDFAQALSQAYGARVEVFDRQVPDGESAAQGIRFHQGDFFKSLPCGYQVVILKNILHDWPDPEALEILRKARLSTELGGRLAVVECVLPWPPSRVPGAEELYALDWNVGQTLAGRERTLPQYQGLFAQADWQLQAVVPTGTPYSVLQGVAL